MKLVVSEKPSVAVSLSRIIGANKRQDGYMEGNGYLVSWCVGHLVELSAPEVYTIEGDTILIPTESVNDGHLHRFEYTTERNVTIRWIVVKKPNSASFGVGFDACEVCGSAGYYERGSQVVCKRCDVVMNINTIGFKGGCNPIPLAYEVNGGNLVFRMEDLLAGEKEFK